MVDYNIPLKSEDVGGHIFEELFFKHLRAKYGISKEALEKYSSTNFDKGIPIFILRTKELSSLESIVKFLRENKRMSYSLMGSLLHRNSKSLAVTYAVARKKLSSSFSSDMRSDAQRIPFAAFSDGLSVLESICVYFRSLDYSYAAISRLICKDQRTVWTVCNRAKNKLSEKMSKNISSIASAITSPVISSEVISPEKKDAAKPSFEKLFFRHLIEKYGISKSDLLEYSGKKKSLDTEFPSDILCTKELSSLESIVKFLREDKSLSYAVIGLLLCRHPKTLAVTYSVTRQKKSEKFSEKVSAGSVNIPFNIFSSGLSVLESICVYFRSLDYSYAAISRLICKDQRTVWTVCNRARRKLENSLPGRNDFRNIPKKDARGEDGQ